MSFKSPLNQVFGLGSAKEGTSHWWQQRLTAIALVPLGLWLAASLANVDLVSYEASIEWVRNPLTAVLLILTVVCLVFHSWLGIQAIFEDYVGHKATKLIMLLASSFGHALLAVTSIFAILKIAFGA